MPCQIRVPPPMAYGVQAVRARRPRCRRARRSPSGSLRDPRMPRARGRPSGSRPRSACRAGGHRGARRSAAAARARARARACRPRPSTSAATPPPGTAADDDRVVRGPHAGDADVGHQLRLDRGHALRARRGTRPCRCRRARVRRTPRSSPPSRAGGARRSPPPRRDRGRSPRACGPARRRSARRSRRPSRVGQRPRSRAGPSRGPRPLGEVRRDAAVPPARPAVDRDDPVDRGADRGWDDEGSGPVSVRQASRRCLRR